MSARGNVRDQRPAQIDFTEFFVRCQPRLLLLFRRQARAMNVEVEDLVQETLVRAYEHRTEFVADENMLAWCYVVARRLLKRWAQAGYSRLVDLHAEVESVVSTIAPDSEEIYLAREEIAAALAAYDSLSGGHREVLRDHLFLDMSCPEIAKVYGITAEAVRARLSRARGALRAAFAEAVLAISGLAVVRRAARRAAGGTAWTTAANVGGVLMLLVPNVTHDVRGDEPVRPLVTLPPAVVREAGLVTSATQAAPGAAGRPDRDAWSFPTGWRALLPPQRYRAPTIRETPDLPVCVKQLCMPGDTIGVDLPAVGHRETTQNAIPVCDTWVPNPVATCERHGDPEWVAPLPSPAPSSPWPG